MKEEIARKARYLVAKEGEENLSVSAQRVFVNAWLQPTKHLPDNVIRETFQIILNS